MEPGGDGELAGRCAELMAHFAAGDVPANTAVKACVRETLRLLADRHPGRAVEVRVPPFGAVQILGGTTHRRGTPPAVVECPPRVWLELAVGELLWAEAVSSGRVRASGERSDLGALLPLW